VPDQNPPAELELLWCPTCGRDDRFTALRFTLPHNAPTGGRCPGKVQRVRYAPESMGAREQRLAAEGDPRGIGDGLGA
jgi:hypothetical protein